MEDKSTVTRVLKDTFKRTLVKTISYRLFIIMLDFITVYLFTKKVGVALGFVGISNVYTTVAYFFHERFWERVKWGRKATINQA